MRFLEIETSEATEEEDISQQMLQELLVQPNWRCYSTTHYPERIEMLADTFLSLHATGFLIDPTIPVRLSEPPIVIQWRDKDTPWIKTKGVIYANGAVAVQDNTDIGKRTILLFVEEETAAKYNYPNEGYINAYQAIAEEVKREIENAAADTEHE